MKNSVKMLGATCVTLAMMVSIAAAASWRNLPPTLGAPWQSGVTSQVDTNWNYADNVLTNGATTARTWTVPFTTDDAFANTTVSTRGVFADGIGAAGSSTAQVIVNRFDGTRLASGAVVQAPSTSLTSLALGNFVQPTGATIYVNYVIGASGRVSASGIFY